MTDERRITQRVPEVTLNGAAPGRPDDSPYCPFCGNAVSGESAPAERFGQAFCSEAHAEEFAQRVRLARIQAAARRTESAVTDDRPRVAASWGEKLKSSLCWSAPLLILLGLPLVSSGDRLAAVGGSLLSAIALLACPLGMYFMMRSMSVMGGGKSDGPKRNGRNGQDR